MSPSKSDRKAIPSTDIYNSNINTIRLITRSERLLVFTPGMIRYCDQSDM